jgi:hypothetical protein
MIKSAIITLLLALVIFPIPVQCQKRKVASFNKADEPTQAQVAEEAERSKDLCERLTRSESELIAAADDYKASLQRLLTLQENDVKTASETVERRKKLLAENGSPFYEESLEEGKRTLASAQGKVSDTNRVIDEANKLIAEATAKPPKSEADCSNTDWLATARQVLRARNREARLARLARRRAAPRVRTDVEMYEIIIRYRVLRTPSTPNEGLR